MPKIEAFGISFDTDSITTMHKIIAGAALSVAILGSAGYYMLYPQFQQLQTLNDEIAQQEEEIAKKTDQAKNLKTLKEELKGIENKLVKLRSRIPKEANVAPLMLDIEEMTENQALYGNSAVLNEFKPSGVANFSLPAELQDAKESKTAKQLKQLPVGIRLSQISYPDLIKLLTDYESYERTLSVENLQITPIEDLDELYTPVNVQFTLKAFLIDEKTPLEKPVAKTPKKAAAKPKDEKSGGGH